MPNQRFRVRSATLSFRSGPSRASELLGKLKRDDILDPIDESDDGKWIRFRREADGLEGWCVKGFLQKLPRKPRHEFPWMTIAEKEKGVSETPGAGNTPRVLEYLNATTNIGSAERSRDETPWCSAFVNWCLAQAGVEGTKSALARSWLNWGQPIDTPRPGCIVILAREKIFGHVGFYMGEKKAEIKVLGGNQQDAETQLYQVSEKYYPEANLLGYRIPR